MAPGTTRGKEKHFHSGSHIVKFHSQESLVFKLVQNLNQHCQNGLVIHHDTESFEHLIENKNIMTSFCSIIESNIYILTSTVV